MDSHNSTLRATVRGFVQGVGFRVFVRSAAWKLDIKGFVKNMPDGTLHVVACGRKPALEQLLKAIWRGPAGADVAAVDTEWSDGEDSGLCVPFEVKH
ncbi:MAG: acylphosphatase [Chloroflexota bacterium]